MAHVPFYFLLYPHSSSFWFSIQLMVIQIATYFILDKKGKKNVCSRSYISYINSTKFSEIINWFVLCHVLARNASFIIIVFHFPHNLLLSHEWNALTKANKLDEFIKWSEPMKTENSIWTDNFIVKRLSGLRVPRILLFSLVFFLLFVSVYALMHVHALQFILFIIWNSTGCKIAVSKIRQKKIPSSYSSFLFFSHQTVTV